jgi:hypothetical protein
VSEQLRTPAKVPAPPVAPAAGRAEPADPSGNGAAVPAALGVRRVSIASLAARARREAGPIGWAAFLASSWTWCIGMFLPVLMTRDYGGWGWLLFAAPNVIGAATMGWVLRDRDASLDVQQAHIPACRWFSIVTVAFHMFFVIALVPRLIGDEFITLAVAVIPLVLALWGGRGRRATLAASIVLAVSVLAMLAYVAVQGLTPLPAPAKPRADLLWMAPVTFFGFLLAPYLDLTFHRARQSTTRAGGRTAFGVGFGVFFLLMIVFTAQYADPLIAALAGTRQLSMRTELFVAVMAVHLALQTAFTVWAHAEAVKNTRHPAASPWPAVLGAAATIGLAVLLRWTATHFPVYHGYWGQRLNSFELIYRMFMAFYGLVFPAYVWLFMVPALRHRRPVAARPPRTATLVFFGAVVVMAAPMYWMGFIEGRMLWLVPGLLLVMLSRLLLPNGPPAAPAVP